MMAKVKSSVLSTQIAEIQFLSVAQSAEKYGIHPNTIRNLINRGQLPAKRLGARVIRIAVGDLDNVFTDYVGGEYSTWNR